VRGITFIIIIIIISSSSSSRSSREKRNFTAVKFSSLWLLLFPVINYICKWIFRLAKNSLLTVIKESRSTLVTETVLIVRI
jgi:Kef-type K+ transport system membrane component KefB